MTLQRDPTISEPGDQGAPARSNPSPAMDWRFLLPEADLGRVGVWMPLDAALTERFAGCADDVVDLRETNTPCDVVVLTAPSTTTLRTVLTKVEVKRAIRLEDVPRRRRRGQARLLADHGYQVSTWWARPSTADTRYLIALDHGPASATILRTVARRARWSILEAWLAERGLARRWAGGISLLATAPSVNGEPAAHAVAAPNGRATLSALVTPRYARSRTVVGITTNASGRSLSQVVKVPRSRSDERHVRAEANILDQFLAQTEGADRAPSGHHLDVHSGRLVLVEDAATGMPLDRRAVRQDSAAALVAGLRWLEQVPVGTASCLDTDGRGQDLIKASLDQLGGTGSQREAWRDRARRLLEPLLKATLPVVFEHGDFSHPNLFVTEDGELVAIDWERGQPRGLPFHDLTFYTAYLAESIDRPRNPEDLVASYRRAIRHLGWARADLDLHIEHLGIDRRLVPLLEVACWTRSLADLSTAPGPSNRSEPHRYELLWMAAIEDAEQSRR